LQPQLDAASQDDPSKIFAEEQPQILHFVQGDNSLVEWSLIFNQSLDRRSMNIQDDM